MRIGAAFQSGQPQTCLEAESSVSKGDAHISSKLISLLFLIRETQSVRDACSRMQISCSTAWNMLNTAENALGYPLLLRNKGGPSGTGSLLTEKGQAPMRSLKVPQRRIWKNCMIPICGIVYPFSPSSRYSLLTSSIIISVFSKNASIG